MEEKIIEKADRVEEEANKEVEKKIERAVDKAVEKESGLKKNEKEAVKIEVKKRLSERFLESAGKAGGAFRSEFKKQSLTAISAAFGFLIALSWREPISDFVNFLIEGAGLKESAIYYKFVSAVVVTLIAVVFLVFLTKWNEKK